MTSDLNPKTIFPRKFSPGTNTMPLVEWDTSRSVFAIAVSPEGTLIGVACGSDIMMWTTTGEHVLGPLRGHRQPIYSLAFSPDGRALASGSLDLTIRVWDAKTGRGTLGPLYGHADEVDSLTYSCDNLLISGSSDRTIRLWDAVTGQPVRKPLRTGSPVWSVAVSPDGMKIAGACNDGTITVYYTATGLAIFQYTDHTEPALSVSFSPDGLKLAAGSQDGTIRIWDAITGHPIGIPLRGHSEGVRCAVFSADSECIASASEDRTIRIWDAETGRMAAGPLLGHKSVVKAVAFTPKEGYLVSGAFDRKIKIWNLSNMFMRRRTTNQPVSKKIRRPKIKITSTTSAADIVACLRAHGCIEMSHMLDQETFNEHPIAAGGYGDIYRCSLVNGHDVAIKTIRVYTVDDEDKHKSLKHAAREIYTWSKCRHVYVQPLLGLVVFRDQIGMATTWETNGALPGYLKLHPEQINAEHGGKSAQIAEGLAYLHSNDIIHGDLKGVLSKAAQANVLISSEGLPRLSDFGNASLREYSLQFTSTENKTFTSRWAAPELLAGLDSSSASDIYALGMTIFETITGEIPWKGKREEALMYSKMSIKVGPSRPMKHIPGDSVDGDKLWDLLKLCWEFEPERRPGAQMVKAVVGSITQNGLISLVLSDWSDD